MPKKIQVGSVTAALQRAFGFKGRYVPLLDEIIVPVYVVQDPAPAVRTRLVAASRSSNPTAIDQFGHTSLWNPPGSGVLGVVSFIQLQVTLEDDTPTGKPWTVRGFLVNSQTPPAGSVSAGRFRDTRYPDSKTGLEVRAVFDTNATSGNFFAQVLFPGGIAGGLPQVLRAESNDPRQPLVVLAPGSYLEANTPENSVGAPAAFEPKLRVNFQWLEIPITEIDPFGGLPGT